MSYSNIRIGEVVLWTYKNRPKYCNVYSNPALWSPMLWVGAAIAAAVVRLISKGIYTLPGSPFSPYSQYFP